MRKKDEASDGGSQWSAPVGGRLTPLDVQQKEFRVTRVGAGYRMREVDEFLDQITDTLSALTAENERLRVSGGGGAPEPEARPSNTSNRADPGAVDAFLQQEKGFLQELGGLVQAHAEELRSMIRAARSDAAAADARTEPEPQAVAAPVVDAEPAPAAEDPVPASDPVEESPEPPPDAVEDDRDPGTITRVVAEEPIHLEEPEPARSARSDEKDGDSLRELFWGEE